MIEKGFQYNLLHVLLLILYNILTFARIYFPNVYSNLLLFILTIFYLINTLKIDKRLIIIAVNVFANMSNYKVLKQTFCDNFCGV